MQSDAVDVTPQGMEGPLCDVAGAAGDDGTTYNAHTSAEFDSNVNGRINARVGIVRLGTPLLASVFMHAPVTMLG